MPKPPPWEYERRVAQGFTCNWRLPDFWEKQLRLWKEGVAGWTQKPGVAKP